MHCASIYTEFGWTFLLKFQGNVFKGKGAAGKKIHISVQKFYMKIKARS